MKNKKGFTLLELIITMSIIAILAAVIVPTSLHFVNKADNDKKQAILEDYISRLYEVANENDPKVNDLASTQALITTLYDRNPEVTAGYKAIAVLNDGVEDFNTDPTVNSNPDYNEMKSGEKISVCITNKDIDGKSYIVFRLKFYKNGKYSNIMEETTFRPL